MRGQMRYDSFFAGELEWRRATCTWCGWHASTCKPHLVTLSVAVNEHEKQCTRPEEEPARCDEKDCVDCSGPVKSRVSSRWMA